MSLNRDIKPLKLKSFRLRMDGITCAGRKPIEQSKMELELELELELESTRTGQLQGLANPALLAQTAAAHSMPTEQHL